jgi:predicted phage terminase large subunit-like protein
MILVYQWREQKETPEVEEAGVSIVRRYEANYLGVEIDGIGLGVIQHIRKKGVAVRGIKCKGSKEARSEIAEIRTSNGAVFFPQGAPFIFDLEDELLSFPKGEYKDQVDAFAHAAILVQRLRGSVRDEKDDEADAYAAAQHEAKQTDRENDELRRYREELRDALDDDE